jgi:hypothetical protein
MKFWKRLRWISSAAFAALLLWSWWAGEPTHPAGSPADAPRTLRF